MERLRVRVLESDQVVSSVVRAAENDTIAGSIQLRDSLGKRQGRHGWRVGINQADAAIAAGQDILRCEQKTFAEAIAALRNQHETIRQQIVEHRLVAHGGVTDQPSGAAFRRDLREVLRGISQEANVKRCCLLECEWGAKPSLHVAGPRGLRHDGKRALRVPRWIRLRGMEEGIGHARGVTQIVSDKNSIWFALRVRRY